MAPKPRFEPRPHEAEAIAQTLEGFQTHDRGKSIMACGTRKTFTALKLAEQVAERNGGRSDLYSYAYGGAGKNCLLYEVHDGSGDDVALVELDTNSSRDYWEDSNYSLPPRGPRRPGDPVHRRPVPYRECGVGIAIIDWGADQYPDRQLIAPSEGTDRFWKSLRWTCVSHPEHHRPMYVSPLE